MHLSEMDVFGIPGQAGPGLLRGHCNEWVQDFSLFLHNIFRILRNVQPWEYIILVLLCVRVNLNPFSTHFCYWTLGNDV